MRRFLVVATAAAALVAVTPATARADVIAPAGLLPGDTFQIVFVTSASTAATSTDMGYYDGFVTTLADNAGLGTYNGLPVTWQDLGTTEAVHAIYREPLTDTNPIYTLSGAEVASNARGLWSGTLLNPIDIDEAGNTTETDVWTGGEATGPSPYALGQDDVEVGVSIFDDIRWEAANDQSGTFDYSLYAISSVLTVPEPSTQTPEPATMAVLGVGLAGLGVVRRRRRIARNP